MTKGQKTVVQDWLKGFSATFFNEGVQKLDLRYDRCLNLRGDCREVVSMQVPVCFSEDILKNSLKANRLLVSGRATYCILRLQFLFDLIIHHVNDKKKSIRTQGCEFTTRNQRHGLLHYTTTNSSYDMSFDIIMYE